MPWNEVTTMSQRKEFVSLARAEGANVAQLCQRFAISRKTGYKWLQRSREEPERDWAEDRSRRPLSHPLRCGEPVEAAILAVREGHPAWGGRKIRRRLELDGLAQPPSASTITAVLHRHGRIDPAESKKRGAMQRFERSRPNELWQMDFKGAVPTGCGLCHPLTVVDDHSRYAVCVQACPDERAETVQTALEIVFRRYGLPERMLMDNGACWGKIESAWTILEVWLIRLGIAVSHGRPYHPQTQGKCERFNRTLKAEALHGRNFGGLDDCQRQFDRFRQCYNHERPHEALGMQVPASRYRVSVFGFPVSQGPVEYLQGDAVRRVGPAGYISWKSRRYHVGRAFTGQPVALRPTRTEGTWQVYFCHQRVATIDERTGLCNQENITN
jgi:transposase InsO family protein